MSKHAYVFMGLALLVGLVLVSCGSPQSSNPPTSPAAPTAIAPAITTASASIGAITRRFLVVPAESSVAYSVREQFFGVTSAVTTTGQTQVISGELVLRLEEPAVSLERGSFSVDLRTLASDDLDRDATIREQWLESNRFPLASFTATSLQDFPANPQEGVELEFGLVGDLTIRNTTRPIPFAVRAQINGDTLRGTATAQLRMRDFGFEPPSLAGVLTVQEGVTLTVTLTIREDTALLTAPAPAAATAVAAPPVTSAPDSPVAFPADYRTRFVRYATVDCVNSQVVRQMYVNPEGLAAMQNNSILPEGTVIVMETYAASRDTNGQLTANQLTNVFLREKRANWIMNLPADLRNGLWKYAWYSTSGRLVSDNSASCHGCHARAAERDYVFTLPDMATTARSGTAPRHPTEFGLSVCQ
ncbi:MAG: cytochrome P460 family protein [Chloroflexaceae bacterium]|nr:cytochrome P460 family protein [Chloroflexaceae bacterium]